ERVRHPQQPPDQLLAGCPVELEDSAVELVDQFTGLDPEILVRIRGHDSDRAAGRTRRSSWVDSPTSRSAVCRVWSALASVSRVVSAPLLTPTVTCATASGCCCVYSSSSR